MQNSPLAARQLAFFVQHTCCSNKRLKSDLQLKLRKNYPKVFSAMVALQNAPVDDDPIVNLKRIKLANEFTEAFMAMEEHKSAKKNSKPAEQQVPAN